MDQIYQHFRAEEAPLIDHLQELIATAGNEYRPVLTDFLDPRQQYIATTLVAGQDAVKAHLFGGAAHAEQARLLVAPDYYQPEPEDFGVSLLTIKYPQKFAELHHSTVLGTLINAGVRRETFGDIITDGTTWQVAVVSNMADWFIDNITKVGAINVTLEPTDLAQVVTPRNDWEETVTTVASLRVDTVVAHVFNLSRQRAKGLIEAEKVRLNFAPISRPDLVIGTDDLLSVRGYGRLRVVEVQAITKKEKMRVEFAVIHK